MPHERTVAEVYEDDPRKAIDAALAATQPPPAPTFRDPTIEDADKLMLIHRTRESDMDGMLAALKQCGFVVNAIGAKVEEKANPEPAQAQVSDPFADKYHELLLAVAKKFPGESRHETALRYIREREAASNSGSDKDARLSAPLPDGRS